MGSTLSAVTMSTMAKPMRKYVVGLRKIFSGSTQKARRRRLLAKMVTNMDTNMKIAELKAALIKALYGLFEKPECVVFTGEEALSVELLSSMISIVELKASLANCMF